ncbi:MAG: alpha/beta hydrolase [Fodinibius sp.]|nr:alpha/beta hydrolase [Fodinibius sp.]
MYNFSDLPQDVSKLDSYLAQHESDYDLKPGTEAQIVWNTPDQPAQTEYAIVYLHGFRASHPEGDPVHRRVAESFGYNLYLSRLAEHGIEDEYPLLHLTEDKLLRSARFAFEIGKRLGKKVILMGTSTGGSLALWLAAQQQFQQDIETLILYSPLIRFHGIKAQLLMNGPARALLRWVPGKRYLITTAGTTFAEDRIWNRSYALEGALVLGYFIDHYMQNNLFGKISCPTMVGYYYKNKDEQDEVVSVPAIKKMVSRLRTRTNSVQAVNFPEAKNHVICSSLLSKSDRKCYC